MSLAAAVRVFALALLIALGATTVRADYVTGLNPAGDNFLALRTGPGTSYRMIRRMAPDTVVTVIERRGQWLRVELEDGAQGWAFGQYIEPGLPPGYDEEYGGPDEEEEFEGEELVEPEGAPEEERAIEEEGAANDEGQVVGEEVTDEVGQQWTRYANDRFGTAVDYPAGLFKALPPPANDDGRSFAARQGEGGFSVFGSNNAFGMTLDELMADDEAGGGYDSVTLRRTGEDWYMLSGYRGGLVFFRKVILGEGGEVVHTFEINYPRTKKSTFDPVAARMAQSMSAGGGQVATEEGEAPNGKEAVAQEGVAEAVPLVTHEVLFDGTLGDSWVAHSASGGDFARDARLEKGTLAVDVPAESGWGNAGILSPGGLVWLDDLGPNAEATVTFSFDPKRTTGFVVSLTVPGGNPWGAPHVTMAWSRVADGASGEARFFLSSTEPFKTIELPAASPAQVKVMLRPYEVAWSIDGGDEIVGAFPSARPGTGLHVGAYSNTFVWNASVSMALKSITLDQVRDPVVEAMKAVEDGVLFDGTESSDWEPISVGGGDHATWGRYRGGYLVVDAPEGSGWGQAGIVSDQAAPRSGADGRLRPWSRARQGPGLVGSPLGLDRDQPRCRWSPHADRDGLALLYQLAAAHS